MRQFRITYILKETNSASFRTMEILQVWSNNYNNAEMRQFKITYRLKEMNSASIHDDGDITGME